MCSTLLEFFTLLKLCNSVAYIRTAWQWSCVLFSTIKIACHLRWFHTRGSIYSNSVVIIRRCFNTNLRVSVIFINKTKETGKWRTQKCLIWLANKIRLIEIWLNFSLAIGWERDRGRESLPLVLTVYSIFGLS